MKIKFSVHLQSGLRYKPRDLRSMRYDDGELVMEPSSTLRFIVDYPLTRYRSVEVTHENGSPWTQTQFVEEVRKAYAEIYAAEKDPGHIPGTLNRSTSDGPYGIWGHDLGDLVLEGAEKKEDGSWELIVGS